MKLCVLIDIYKNKSQQVKHRQEASGQAWHNVVYLILGGRFMHQMV